MDVDSEAQPTFLSPRKRGQVDKAIRRQSSASCSPLPSVDDRLHSLAATLVRQDAMSFYAENSYQARACWVSLLKQTSISASASCFDPAIVSSFRTLDHMIMSKRSSPLVSRLAYVQLIRLFDTVEETIEYSRRHGFVHRAAGYRNASIALDIYMKAQEGYADAASHRRQLLERKRAGRRWKQLAGPSPLFLLVYSDAAERIVYVKPPPTSYPN
jgi:hypothetical protein